MQCENQRQQIYAAYCVSLSGCTELKTPHPTLHVILLQPFVPVILWPTTNVSGDLVLVQKFLFPDVVLTWP